MSVNNLKANDVHPDEPSPNACEHDDVMRRALPHVAAGVQRPPVRQSFLESLLEEALVRAWAVHALAAPQSPACGLVLPGGIRSPVPPTC